MLIVHWSENTAFPLGKKLVESLYMKTKCSNKFRHFEFSVSTMIYRYHSDL